MNTLILLFAFGQMDAAAVSQKLLNHFQSLNNGHIQGSFQVSTGTGNQSFTEKAEFDYYKKGVKAKYLEHNIEIKVKGKQLPQNQFISMEKFTNEFGLFSHNNDPVTGKYRLGGGILWEGKKSTLGVKTIEINRPLAPLTGNFAFTVVNMPTNPCFSFEELLGISKAELSEDQVDGQKAQLLTLRSAWGLVRIWLDPVLFRPIRVESELTGNTLQATGVTVEASQSKLEYKTLSYNRRYFYTYSPGKTILGVPTQIKMVEKSLDLIEGEQREVSEESLFIYSLVEPFSQSMNKNFIISSTAKNGTKIHINNQPQIAYHLEDGQLVLSANHKFLNQISQTVFGGIGFWQRFFLTLGPLLVTGIMAFWVWHRLRHKIQ